MVNVLLYSKLESETGSASSSIMAEQVLTRVTTKEQLLALANVLAGDFPLSVTIYNCLIFHVQDWLSCMNFFTLDDPSHSHAVIMQMINLPSFVFVYCRESEVNSLIQAIKKTNQLMKQEDLIYTVPHYLEEPLQMLAQEMEICVNTNIVHRFIYQPHLDTDPLRCGPGFRVCRLGKAGLQQLLLKSTFLNNKIPEESMLRLTENVPAVGVYLDPSVTKEVFLDIQNLPYAGDNEIPVSWISPTVYGTLGMLGTEKDFRRLGHATLVTRVAARLFANKGCIPLCHIVKNNTASKEMFKKMTEWQLIRSEISLTSAETKKNIN
ncbi:uncharacterized protein [Cherax quadricarinatus]|uniref:uncharacterized protein isoform X3 n=1 Tax=Cherax quadricarinatus TaxID=27406 RepID=UPI00387E6960